MYIIELKKQRHIDLVERNVPPEKCSALAVLGKLPIDFPMW